MALPRADPATARDAGWGPELCASGDLEGPRARCADGGGGDTPSCHRRCPGLSQRARAGEVGTAQADAAVAPPARGVGAPVRVRRQSCGRGGRGPE